ncbi:hypothetical protein I5M27_04780 [Adhaeribacter sp. BT258]|uniref:Uncharacterized protein n=1 Tax=Adhaeribacter terrigena TaxID=2793070 RepID=A0ABS1BYT5_9BACT|nr:hypothetical protein [Adhaeribacter terrigena]MBK0402287.1 hypothetical protein [Adhaeribacter terrigena]
MSAASFEYLLENAFGPDHALTKKIMQKNLYENFIAAEDKHRLRTSQDFDEELAFAFERLRLGIGVALIQVFVRLSENPESKQVVDLLLKALEAKSIEEIDKIMHEGVAAFDNLYTDVFVNKDREAILELFEKNLEAENKAQLNGVLRDGLAQLDHIDWDHDSE